MRKSCDFQYDTKRKLQQHPVTKADLCVNVAQVFACGTTHLVLVKRLLPKLLVEVQQTLVRVESILESHSLFQVATAQLRSKAAQKLRVPFSCSHGVLDYRNPGVSLLGMLCFGLVELRAAAESCELRADKKTSDIDLKIGKKISE